MALSANGYDQCAMQDFIPGLELASKFYEEAVRPILESVFSALPYSAALIGSGSEVLGFDNEMSADHHWGPRVMLFLRRARLRAPSGRAHRNIAAKAPAEIPRLLDQLLCARSARQQRATPPRGRVRRESIIASRCLRCAASSSTI
jgi:hypothetical protein